MDVNLLKPKMLVDLLRCSTLKFIRPWETFFYQVNFHFEFWLFQPKKKLSNIDHILYTVSISL